MNEISRRLFIGISAALTASAAAFAQDPAHVPATTKEEIKGAAEVTKEHLTGTVVQVEGQTLLVRTSTGEMREFQVPKSRKFQIDGKQLSVNQLKPGTELTATVTTTKTPVTARTTTIGSGTVWWVAGNQVIVTLPNHENKLYTVEDSYRFIVDGQQATVHDLKPGMKISAQRIVEEPRTEITSDTVVTGHAPSR
jgi:hypothetical protein